MTRPRFPRPMEGKVKGKENAYEEAYREQVLVPHLRGGQSRRWGYEDITLLLCEGVKYTPDFSEVLQDRIRLVEIKAGDKDLKPIMTDGSRYKLRMACEKFDEYQWILAVVRKIPKRDGGGFLIKEIQLNGEVPDVQD